MYVLIGNQTKVEEDLWAGKTTCPKCGQQCDFHLVRLVQIATVFFVPIMSATKKRYIVCDSCDFTKELKRKEYKEIKKRQFELFENGGFPKEMIRHDCHPDKVKFGWRIFKLVLSSLLAFIVLLSMGGMLISTIISGSWESEDFMALIFVLLCVGLYCIPFILSLKNFLPALKKYKAYNSLTGE